MSKIMAFTSYGGELFRIQKKAGRRYRVWKVEDQSSAPGIEVETLAFFGNFEGSSFTGAANAARTCYEQTRTCR